MTILKKTDNIILDAVCRNYGLLDVTNMTVFEYTVFETNAHCSQINLNMEMKLVRLLEPRLGDSLVASKLLFFP
jgi:hypothetical protein